MTLQNQTVLSSPQEKLLTVKRAAQELDVPYRQLLLEVQAGKIPSYRVGKSRTLVFVSEVLASISVSVRKEINHV